MVHMCTCVKWLYLQPIFLCLKILIFGDFREWVGWGGGVREQKMTYRYHFQCAMYLYFRNCRSHQRDFDNDIYRWFFYFFKKMQHFKYWNYFVFYWPTSSVFLITICFSSSSTNAKKKFWGVPHLLYICGIFTFLCSLVCLCVNQSVFLWLCLQSISNF